MAGDVFLKQSGNKRLKRKRSKRRVPVRIDMTPMVDIAFLLLIFYMVSTVFALPQAIEINQPKTPGIVEVKDVLTIRVDSIGQYWWNFGLESPENLPIIIPSKYQQDNTIDHGNGNIRPVPDHDPAVSHGYLHGRTVFRHEHSCSQVAETAPEQPGESGLHAYYNSYCLPDPDSSGPPHQCGDRPSRPCGTIGHSVDRVLCGRTGHSFRTHQQNTALRDPPALPGHDPGKSRRDCRYNLQSADILSYFSE